MATTTPHYFSLELSDAPVVCPRFVWSGGYKSRYSVHEEDRLCSCGASLFDHSIWARMGVTPTPAMVSK